MLFLFNRNECSYNLKVFTTTFILKINNLKRNWLGQFKKLGLIKEKLTWVGLAPGTFGLKCKQLDLTLKVLNCTLNLLLKLLPMLYHIFILDLPRPCMATLLLTTPLLNQSYTLLVTCTKTHPRGGSHKERSLLGHSPKDI